MSEIQRIQDSVHGLMEFKGMERAVLEALDTPELQRLRRIRHLGMAHLVFPSAEHSRFSHVLGAAHLAILFARRLVESAQSFLAPDLSPNEGAIRDVALAALCHDLGEGPTSHAWENFVLGRYDSKLFASHLGLDGDDRFEDMPWHELVTQAILNNSNGSLHRLLESYEPGTAKRIRHMLLGDHHLTYLPAILSSDIDVDRSDYILRDGILTGVRYGRFDLGWLLSTIEIGTDGDKLVFGFDRRKAPKVIEQFITARRAMYDTVYHHKTVQGAEAMIGLLFRQLSDDPDQMNVTKIKDGLAFSAYSKIFRKQDLSLDEIMTLDDHSLSVLIWELAESDADPAVAKLCRRLVSRDLFKTVGSNRQVQKFFEDPDAHDKIQEVLKKYVPPTAAKHWYRYVSTERTLVSKDARKRVLLIDMDRRDRHAEPLAESDDLRELTKALPPLHRLFVPREARDEIERLLKS